MCADGLRWWFPACMTARIWAAMLAILYELASWGSKPRAQAEVIDVTSFSRAAANNSTPTWLGFSSPQILYSPSPGKKDPLTRTLCGDAMQRCRELSLAVLLQKASLARQLASLFVFSFLYFKIFLTQSSLLSSLLSSRICSPFLVYNE